MTSMEQIKITKKESETIRLAKKFSRGLKPGDVIALIGELGSGKTVFAKGIAQGLGIKAPVTSPTFTLLQIYEARKKLFHFDLYRLDSPEELVQIGYEEFFYGNGIVLVEWADKFPELLPPNSYKVSFKYKDKDIREIRIQRP